MTIVKSTVCEEGYFFEVDGMARNYLLCYSHLGFEVSVKKFSDGRDDKYTRFKNRRGSLLLALV